MDSLEKCTWKSLNRWHHFLSGRRYFFEKLMLQNLRVTVSSQRSGGRVRADCVVEGVQQSEGHPQHLEDAAHGAAGGALQLQQSPHSLQLLAAHITV